MTTVRDFDDVVVIWLVVSVLGFVIEASVIVLLGRQATAAYEAETADGGLPLGAIVERRRLAEDA